jgi:hypothetical protein
MPPLYAESILIAPGLGVVLSKYYASGRTCSQFMAIDAVEDILLNEAILFTRIVFYLTLVTKDEESDGCVVFSHLLPPLSLLEKVYVGAKKNLLGAAGS